MIPMEVLGLTQDLKQNERAWCHSHTMASLAHVNPGSSHFSQEIRLRFSGRDRRALGRDIIRSWSELTFLNFPCEAWRFRLQEY